MNVIGATVPIWFVPWTAFVVLTWLLLAVLAARDVSRKGGPAVWTFVLSFVFWPGALYLWAWTRGRHQGSVART